MDLNPDGYGVTFDFIFQVWRPSPAVKVSGCYSLVNDFMSKKIALSTDSPLSERVARITPLPQQQLQFQLGDVLGFYVESHGQGDVAGGDHDNGVVLLNNDTDYRSESVWFASIDVTAQPSQSGSCPYPVGTSGVLNSLTRAAPVISISMTTYSCPPYTTYLPLSSSTTITDSKDFTKPGNESSAMSTTSINYLVLGVSVSVMALIVLVIFTAVIVAAVVTGKYSGKQSNLISATNTERTNDSDLYVYDSLAINTAHSIQLKSNVAYAAHSKTLHVLS